MTGEYYEQVKKEQDDFLWSLDSCVTRLESLLRDFEDMRSTYDCDAKAISQLAKAGIVPGAKIRINGYEFEVKEYENECLLLLDEEGNDRRARFFALLKVLEAGNLEVKK